MLQTAISWCQNDSLQALVDQDHQQHLHDISNNNNLSTQNKVEINQISNHDYDLFSNIYFTDDIYNHLINIVAGNVWFISGKLRFLFYLVWPTETMFSSLDEVPRYVAEVSLSVLQDSISNNAALI